MSKKLISQLKNLKHKEIAPSDAWLKQNRGFLLSQIKNNAVPHNHTAYESFWIGVSVFFGEGLMQNIAKPLSVLLIVALVGTSGWIATVDAAYESLPGDILYGAKRVIEKTQIVTASITGNKTSETKLHAEFAKRRANEIKKVSVSDDPNKIEKVSEAVIDLKNEMNNLTTNLEESKQVNIAADTFTDVKRNTDQIKIVLNDVKDSLSLVATSTEDITLVKDLSEAKEMIKDITVKTVEVAVTKHLEGDTSVSKEDIKQMLGDAVKDSISETLQKTENLVGVSNAVEAVKSEVRVLDSATSTSFSVSSSEDIAKKIENIASTTKQAALQTEEAIKDSDKKTDELQAMLNSDNLAGVLNMVKEVNEVNKSVEKIVDKAVVSAQTALPIVAEVIKEKTDTITLTTSTVNTGTTTVNNVTGTVLIGTTTKK